VCGVIGVKADEKKQSLLVDIGKTVPEEVNSDQMRISQVITNLLSNAVKFTPENGTIRLSVQNEGDTPDGRFKLRVSVADNGIGISEKQAARLFMSFEQADADISRRYGGTGLGLAISKKIVELMDGEINVESKPGQGSTFTFTAMLKKPPLSRSKLYDTTIYRGLKVLVTDDAPDVLDYFKTVLTNFGMECDLASNGEDAVRLSEDAIAAGAPYRIAFIDYLMEEMDGIEATRRIKALHGGGVGVIMVSNTEWGAIEHRAKRAGVDGFIPKPLFTSPILDSINKLVFKNELDVAAGQGTKDAFKGKKMLLAEDIEINREIVLSLLEDTGIEIFTAENGQEAVDMFAANPKKYDVIVMDVQMPIMDGLAATRAIKAMDNLEAKRMPIIAMTANAFAEDVEACKQAGMIDHIGKPIDFDILISKLREWLKT
jgi:CheY-like chemotaxis protein